NLIISVQLSVTYPVAIPVYASKGEKYSDYKNTKLRTKEDQLNTNCFMWSYRSERTHILFS
ncbi:hypothetical protein, partial [Kurthia huakuii]|uniref:hypothetical protein n=1 Tax=Kurthia huakuii TaxID=1421019 RepID=UPI001F1A7DB4